MGADGEPVAGLEADAAAQPRPLLRVDGGGLLERPLPSLPAHSQPAAARQPQGGAQEHLTQEVSESVTQ